MTLRLDTIRHGQSQGNAGEKTETNFSIELTELGISQALEVSQRWDKTQPPNLIVASQYFRTQQTAKPTSELFPEVRCELWDVREFSYLSAGRFMGTSIEERRPAVLEYWARGDASYRDDEGCESFEAFFKRVRWIKWHLEGRFLRGDKHIIMFSHSQFLTVLRRQILGKSLSDLNDEMKSVWEELQHQQIPNAQGYTVHYDGKVWTTDIN